MLKRIYNKLINMTILVEGASGAAGRQLVEQLLIKGHNIKAVVRSPEKLPESWKSNERVKLFLLVFLI